MIKWRKVRLAEHVMHMGEMRSARIIFVGRPEGKRHFRTVPVTGREGP
jgi:hypothetical protein